MSSGQNGFASEANVDDPVLQCLHGFAGLWAKEDHRRVVGVVVVPTVGDRVTAHEVVDARDCLERAHGRADVDVDRIGVEHLPRRRLRDDEVTRDGNPAEYGSGEGVEDGLEVLVAEVRGDPTRGHRQVDVRLADVRRALTASTAAHSWFPVLLDPSVTPALVLPSLMVSVADAEVSLPEAVSLLVEPSLPDWLSSVSLLLSLPDAESVAAESVPAELMPPLAEAESAVSPLPDVPHATVANSAAQPPTTSCLCIPASVCGAGNP